MIAFRSHGGFKSEYCNPASGNEKGGVEGELGWFRRNWLVPVPEASDLASLNEQLADSVRSGQRAHDHRQKHHGRAGRQGVEQPYLPPLAEERFPVDEILYPLLVDGKRMREGEDQLVFHAPVAGSCGVTARVWPSLVEVEHDGKCVVRATSGAMAVETRF